MLHEFVTANRDEIITRCRTKVATRSDPPPTTAEIEHGVPRFLDQLVDGLRLGLSSNPEIAITAGQHGQDLLGQGFTAAQVVQDYGDVCQAITELAIARHAPISTDDFKILNRCLDDAIASAITTYGHDRDQSCDEDAADETARLRILTRELGTMLHAANNALAAIYSGKVGVAGSTATILDRSLHRALVLQAQLLVEVSAPRRNAEPVDAVAVKA